MRVLVIRHGCAEDKRDWAGPDPERPLDVAGYRQAAALVALARSAARSAASCPSPTKRCVDTVVPLAHARGLRVEEDARLARHAPGEHLMDGALAPEFADAVLCTHGELMSEVLVVFRAAGVPIVAERTDDAWLLAKGAGWDLSVEDGRVTGLRHFHPAPDLACKPHARAARRRARPATGPAFRTGSGRCAGRGCRRCRRRTRSPARSRRACRAAARPSAAP